MSTDPSNTIKFLHGVGGVADVVGYPTKFWYAIKKYSINGTISTVAINTWVQFTLAYIAAIMITHNDLSFLTNILDPSAISLYALVSLVLVAAFLTSVTLKYIHEQEIKDEKSINDEIRGGQSDEINHLAQDARAIEIFPDISHITDQKISIIVPIAGKQGTALENQAAENRNKVIFITAPYVISNLIVIVALGKFGFANIRGWEEISFISMVVAIAVIGALVALGKLKDNKVKQMSNTTVKFGSPHIIPFFNTFVPFSQNKIALVMENKVESSKDNGMISQALKLVDRRLTDFIGVIDSSVLKPLSAKAQKTLDGVRADIRTLFHTLETNITRDVDGVKTTADKAITECLQGIAESVNKLCKGVEGSVKDKLDEVNVEEMMDLINALKDIADKINDMASKINAEGIMIAANNVSKFFRTAEDRVAKLTPGAYGGFALGGFSKERMPDIPDHDEVQPEFIGMIGAQDIEVKKLNEKLNKLQAQLNNERTILKEIQGVKELLAKGEQEKPNRTDPDSGNGSENGDNAANPPDSEEDKLLKIKKGLESQERIRILNKQIKELKAKHAEEDKQDAIDAWNEKLNGPPRAFFHHLLGSIYLIINGKKVPLQSVGNKLVAHMQDGAQITFDIHAQEKTVEQPEVVPPDTNVDVKNPSIRAMYVAVCPG